MTTRRTVATLQPKLDRMLARCIRDVKSLGYRPVGRIKPKVRITKNTRGIGQCRETTGAYYRRSGDKPGVRRLRAGAKPVFEISCSVNAGNSDEEFLDVLYHEVIHTLPGCFSHGKEFQEAAKRVNEAFGCNVTTTKDAFAAKEDTGLTRKEERSMVDELIGSSFKGDDGHRMTLVATNPRARKHYCHLRDEETGRTYACPPSYVLERVLAEDAAEGDSGDEGDGAAAEPGDWKARMEERKKNGATGGAKADATPYAFLTGAAARKIVSAMVGKVFLDRGDRLRLDGINSRAPKNCCQLRSMSTGKQYVAPPEYVLRLSQE